MAFSLGDDVWTEFEKIAEQKGWIKTAEVDADTTTKIQHTFNSLADLFVGYAPLRKIKVDGIFGPATQGALDAVRVEIMKPAFSKLYEELGELYYSARSKLHSPEPSLWLDGLMDLGQLFENEGIPKDKFVESYKSNSEVGTDGEFSPPKPSGVADRLPLGYNADDKEQMADDDIFKMADEDPYQKYLLYTENLKKFRQALREMGYNVNTNGVWSTEEAKEWDRFIDGNPEIAKLHNLQPSSTDDAGRLMSPSKANMLAVADPQTIKNVKDKRMLSQLAEDYFTMNEQEALPLQSPDVVMEDEPVVIYKESPMYKKVQQTLKGMGYNVKDDGVWGPKTAKAWNDFLRSDRDLAEKNRLNFVGVDGLTPPSQEDMEVVTDPIIMNWVLKQKSVQKPEMTTPGEVYDHIPKTSNLKTAEIPSQYFDRDNPDSIKFPLPGDPVLKSQPRVYEKSPAIGAVQNVLKSMGYNLSVDNTWGPSSAKAWNDFIKNHKNISVQNRLSYTDENGISPPTQRDLDVVSNPDFVRAVKNLKVPAEIPEHVPSTSRPSTPTQNTATWFSTLGLEQQKRVKSYVSMLVNKGESQETALQKAKALFSKEPTTAPDDLDLPTGEGLMEDISEQMRQKYPNFNLGASKINNTLIALGNDLKAMGAKDASVAVDGQRRMFRETITTYYGDLFDESAEDLFEKAHPESPVEIVPARDNQGVVENAMEKQKKDVALVMKDPDGIEKTRRYAELINQLTIKANELETQGHYKKAELVDRSIHRLREAMLPFVVGNIRPEATNITGDFYASIKTASVEELRQYIPEWDRLVAEFEEIRSHLNSRATFGNTTATSYSNAGQLIFDIGNNWRNDFLDQKGLIQGITQIIRVLMGAKGSSGWFEDFGNEDWARRHTNLISNFSIFSKKIIRNSQPSNEERKKSLPQEKSKNTPWLNSYKASLNKVIKAIEEASDKLIYALGNNNREDGYKRAKILLDWAQKELVKTYSELDAKKLNEDLWNGIIKPLANKLSVASYDKNILKESALPFRLDGKPTATTRQQGGGRARQRSNENVKALQLAIIQAGIPIAGRNPTDGIWGKNTADAYNKLMAQIAQYNPNIRVQEISADPTAVNENTINRGIQASQYLAKVQETTAISNETIQLTDTITLNGRDLRNPNSYLSALDKGGHLSGFTTAKQRIGVGLEYLKEFARDKLNDPLYTQGLDFNQKGSADRLIASVNSLAQALQANLRELEQRENLGMKDSETQPSTPNLQILNAELGDMDDIIKTIQMLNVENLRTPDIFNASFGGNQEPAEKFKLLKEDVISLKRTLYLFRPKIVEKHGQPTYNDLDAELNRYLSNMKTLEMKLKGTYRALS